MSVINGQSYESAVLLQRAVKTFLKSKKAKHNAMKQEMLEKITMSTQTEGHLTPPLELNIRSWTDSHPVLRVLLIFSNPSNTHPLRLQAEEKCIRDALRGGKFGERVVVDVLPACTIDDLARQLMTKTYEIIHFSGHADRSSALVKHTMGVLMGEHNVEHANFKNVEVIKKIELAAEEVVRQLEANLLQGSSYPGTSLSPSNAVMQSHMSDSKPDGDIECHHRQSVIMHGRLHGEKVIHVPSNLSAWNSSPEWNAAEAKLGDSPCLPASAPPMTTDTLCTNHQQLRAVLSISNLQLRVSCPSSSVPKSPSGGSGENNPASEGHFSSTATASEDCSEQKDQYAEVNMVKYFSHRDLLEIGVGSLAFEGDHGHMAYVSPYTFAALLSNHCPPLQCVILNACGGHIQGEILASVVPQTVCFSGRISDKESLIFSRGFYDSIAEGHSINRAFRDGSSRMELHALSPGVPPRRDISYGCGRLPLVALLKNEQLYRDLHIAMVDTVNQTVRQKDVQLAADNAALLAENNKLRSLITYGMELLQHKDRDLDAMRTALSMLAASAHTPAGRKGCKLNITTHGGAIGMGLLDDLSAGPEKTGSSSSKHRRAHNGSSHADSAKGSCKHVRTAAWKHVSKSTLIGSDTSASRPVKKPKWYKNIQSSGYGKVSFSNVSTSESPSRLSSSKDQSAQLLPPALSTVAIPLALPPPSLSPVQQTQRRRKESLRSSPGRPSSASSDRSHGGRGRRSKLNMEMQEGLLHQDYVDMSAPEVLDIDGLLVPPVLSPASSSEEHVHGSTVLLTDAALSEISLLGDGQEFSQLPVPPSVPARRSSFCPKEKTADTPPRPNKQQAKKSSVATGNAAPALRQSLRGQRQQQQQQQHVISKAASWAKAYTMEPRGEGEVLSTESAPYDYMATSAEVSGPPSAPSKQLPDNSTKSSSNLSRTSHIQRLSTSKFREKQSPSTGPNTTGTVATTSAGAATISSGSAGSSRRSTGGFREKSAGFREFLKEMRSKQSALKPTSSFASSVPRFDSTQMEGGGGGGARSTL